MKRTLCLLLVFFPGLAWASEPAPPGGIASAHPLATSAGIEVLAMGGNAFDAAVAVSAALGVVEPFSSGLGGGGLFLLHRADDGFETMIDGRETAPAAAGPDMYLDAAGEVNTDKVREGALAAGVPGLPAALVHLSRHYGRLDLAEALAPAIRLAEDGFRVDGRLAAISADKQAFLRQHCAPGCPFLKADERPYGRGELLRQPELAAVMKKLAADGGEDFYRGQTAARLVAEVRERGGIWRLDDLSAYRAKERGVIKGEYRGYEITTAAPPSSGGITLIETLNILAGFDLDAMDPATRMHVIAEAWRIAYRDRNEFLGDTDFVTIPAARLMHPAYAAGLRASIRLDAATPSARLPSVLVEDEGDHTSHFSIIDFDGNRVAGTQTVNFRFGGGVVPAGTGVVLNNEMDDFTAKPGEPNGFGLVQGEANAVQPGKRPLSSMTPTFVESKVGGGKGVLVIGTPGGSRIISMVTLGILEYIAGGSAADITALPRYHHQYLPDAINVEPGSLSPELIKALRERGHGLKEGSRRWGNMNIVIRHADGMLEPMTDPRNEVRVEF
ncbi:MAG: gamma-glutamyltransferase [Gammaproteobacteria bacterium]|nr:gamma-glutamyltransferase [Gammaproteobacteria bacterium]